MSYVYLVPVVLTISSLWPSVTGHSLQFLICSANKRYWSKDVLVVVPCEVLFTQVD